MDDARKQAIRTMARKEREARRLKLQAAIKDPIRRAALLVDRCAEYSLPTGAAIFIDPERIRFADAQAERAGKPHGRGGDRAWRMAIRRFCAEWVIDCWIPSLKPVRELFTIAQLRQLPYSLHEKADPSLDADTARHVAHAFNLVRTDYADLIGGRSTLSVVRSVAVTRIDLEEGRHQMGVFFKCLAWRIRDLRPRAIQEIRPHDPFADAARWTSLQQAPYARKAIVLALAAAVGGSVSSIARGIANAAGCKQSSVRKWIDRRGGLAAEVRQIARESKR